MNRDNPERMCSCAVVENFHIFIFVLFIHCHIVKYTQGSCQLGDVKRDTKVAKAVKMTSIITE